METIKCLLDDKDVKILGLANHLRFNHKGLKLNDYWNKFPNQYNEYLDKCKKLINSPNKIEFWTNKGLSDDEAKKALELHRSKLPFRTRNNFRKNQIQYWLDKGYSEEESIVKIKENAINNRKLTLEERSKRLGKELAIVVENNIKNNMQNRKKTEINRLIQEGFSQEESEKIFAYRRKVCSPRTIDYWLEKKFSLEESIKNVSKFQKQMSPRTIFYWIKNGYSEDEAKNKVSEYQDNTSVTKLMSKFSCSLSQAIDIQNSMYINGSLSDPFNDPFNFIEFKKYKIKVKKFTEFNWKKYFTESYDGQTHHIDHKVSVKEGFLNQIPPEIIGSKFNLELLTKKENCQKQANSSMNIRDLCSMYYKDCKNEN